MLDTGTQTRLKDKGYYKGNIDGKFGALSFGALIGYAASRMPDAGILARGELAAVEYPKHGLTASADRLSDYLAQVCIESASFTASRENLNYSAEGILSTWGPGHGSRIKDMAEAKSLARKPQLLANKVYAREEMENTEPNDGYTYRGAFDVQLTGKKNWRIYGAMIGYDLVAKPALANDPKVCHLVALGFWTANKVNEAIDDKDFLGARKIINMGGRYKKGTPNGLGHVEDLRNRILAIL